MTDQKINRRTAIKKTVNSGAALGALASMPHWVLPALAQGEQLVSFTDMPEDYSRPPARQGGTHYLDTRMIDDFYTDNEDFYVVQHWPTRIRSRQLSAACHWHGRSRTRAFFERLTRYGPV